MVHNIITGKHGSFAVKGHFKDTADKGGLFHENIFLYILLPNVF